MVKVAILRNDVVDSVDPSHLDVLTQCREIAASLERSGHELAVVACTLDLGAARTELLCFAPDIVFNLVESLGGTDRLMAAATLLLESMHLPTTGAGTHAILLSGDKLQAKNTMAAAGIPTPAWWDCKSETWLHSANSRAVARPKTVITKANYEHASFALEGDSVIALESDVQLQRVLADRLTATGQVHLSEEFIAGREFNLSLLEIEGQPQVLAPAEIDFRGLPTHVPHIVGSSAKWKEASIEYQQTPRHFDFPPSDLRLIAELSELSIRCWHLFGIRGYARVDFRVDVNCQPYVLEVNANPCLSQDAGFVAAAEQSQIQYDQVIAAILSAAWNGRELHSNPRPARRVSDV